jgi:N-acetylglutamate synthase-like GNAT family acetyltransferase
MALVNAEILISDYKPHHLPEVLAIFRSNIPTYFATEEEPGFINYLNHEIEWYIVLIHYGKIKACGGCNTTDAGKPGIISWGLVHADYHGQGLGAILLAHRLNILHQQPAISSILLRTAQNTYQFYQNYGFELQTIKKDYWHTGIDLYEMVLKS